ncbi:MAG TPA: hypothetical protein VHX61_00260 [Rhizomicrobium sp.]|jgi:hypothetical protein|nr:hypothetical protein [Rhizomicrobium sp.]
MARREPKSQFKIDLHSMGRPGGRRGSLTLSSGAIEYSRQHAKKPTLRLTYRQLFEVFEKECEYRHSHACGFRGHRPHKGYDLSIVVSRDDDDFDSINKVKHLRSFEARYIGLGNYQHSGRDGKFSWMVQISIQMAMWIIDKYVEGFLSDGKHTDHTDKEVVVSKNQMVCFLLHLLKKLDY